MGKTIIAIDPGSVQSGWVVWDGENIHDFGLWENKNLLHLLNRTQVSTLPRDMDLVVEQIRSYGMAVGASTFDTVFWSGRFCEGFGEAFHLMPRLEVKLHLCHDSRAKDSNIRRALIDRFEPDLKPRQRPKGILKGVYKDIWAAMARAVNFFPLNFQENSVSSFNFPH